MGGCQTHCRQVSLTGLRGASGESPSTSGCSGEAPSSTVLVGSSALWVEPASSVHLSCWVLCVLRLGRSLRRVYWDNALDKVVLFDRNLLGGVVVCVLIGSPPVVQHCLVLLTVAAWASGSLTGRQLHGSRRFLCTVLWRPTPVSGLILSIPAV